MFAFDSQNRTSPLFLALDSSRHAASPSPLPLSTLPGAVVVPRRTSENAVQSSTIPLPSTICFNKKRQVWWLSGRHPRRLHACSSSLSWCAPCRLKGANGSKDSGSAYASAHCMNFAYLLPGRLGVIGDRDDGAYEETRRLHSSPLRLLVATGSWSLTAKAADLGGDCCSDFGRRVSELEATTVRKGNRKVSRLNFRPGRLSLAVLERRQSSDVYSVDNSIHSSRFPPEGPAPR